MAVQDTLAGLLQEGGQGVTKEAPIPLAGTAMRPADLLVANWSAGKDTAIDIIVCHACKSGSIERQERPHMKPYRGKDGALSCDARS